VTITDSELEALKNAPKITKMKEVDRLAYVVRAIEIDCAALPIGSLKLLTNHEIRYNKNFQSLDIN
jgi:radial spoke head protein 9